MPFMDLPIELRHMIYDLVFDKSVSFGYLHLRNLRNPEKLYHFHKCLGLFVVLPVDVGYYLTRTRTFTFDHVYFTSSHLVKALLEADTSTLNKVKIVTQVPWNGMHRTWERDCLAMNDLLNAQFKECRPQLRLACERLRIRELTFCMQEKKIWLEPSFIFDVCIACARTILKYIPGNFPREQIFIAYSDWVFHDEILFTIRLSDLLASKKGRWRYQTLDRHSGIRNRIFSW